MTCSDCVQNLGAFIDGELPAEEMAEMEEHLKTCADCSTAHRRLMGTSSRVKAGLMRYEAPDVLKARIRASLADTSRDAPDQRAAVALPRRWTWQSMLTAAAAVAIVSSGVTFEATRDRAAANSIEEQVLSSHIRSLMPGHLTDVASNDQHNVKPWFNGRVNMSPDVPRLDSLGFPLVGGRVDYIDGRSVPVIVYTRRQHVINVYAWPVTTTKRASVRSSSQGYNLIRIPRDGEELWIVSDLNRQELEQFAQLYAGPIR